MTDHTTSSWPDRVAEAFASHDWRKKAQAVIECDLTPEQHERALMDSDWYVRAEAVARGGLTYAQLTRALNDEHDMVRDAARRLRDNVQGVDTQ